MLVYCDMDGRLGINENLEEGSYPLGLVQDDKIDELLTHCENDDENMAYIVTEVAETLDRANAIKAMQCFIQKLVNLEIIEPISFNQMRRLTTKN